MNISGSEFLSNKATYDGGAIKIYDVIPIIEINNKFYNNSASYGNNLACYPTKYGLTVLSSDEKQTLYNSSTQNETLFLILDQMPGYNLNVSLYFNVMDPFNQTVSTLKDA